MKYIYITLFASVCIMLNACSDETKIKKLDFPNDVTFNVEENSIDITVPELGFVQMDAPFIARAYSKGVVTFNAKKNADGTHTGFALSNKNYRSYPWCTSKPFGNNPSNATIQSAADSSLYSVYSGSAPNQLKNFAVARVSGEDAYFTIDSPKIVEHILIANCTFNYLAMTYGTTFSSNLVGDVYEEMKDGKLAAVRNPNIPDPATSKYGVWTLPDYYNFSQGEGYVRLRSNGYFKVTATGYRGSSKTGTSDYYLAVKPGIAPSPYDKWNIIQSFWAKWDLSDLGEVDKIVFTLDGSEKTANGNLKTAPYFCIDGIRLK